ncbi:hypothetical protein NLJ89_g12339 [Agrocybe chaxingu]|uniref:Saccharopine dehydrogenase NADP binding domain-containing protein n=1 Tax=Agrocybe chaxingu TaxID=84603 RepID=A0A9W8JV00_9AGAR|nr:hypothetical protein NLJ89_g12339 [Agrocybe chaxingu]
MGSWVHALGARGACSRPAQHDSHLPRCEQHRALEAAVAAVDLVISLIPYTHHAAVISAAIKGKTHVVTTSYVSPAMRALDQAAKDAGIVVMNEIGVDPGIDHLYAIKVIEEVHEKGGKVSPASL